MLMLIFLQVRILKNIDEVVQGTKQYGGNFHSSGDFESNEDDYVNSGHNVDDYFSPND
jgi:hypothetical protein